MRLADFIEENAKKILDDAEVFARTQVPAGVTLDSTSLRDHLPQIMKAIVLDLRTPQSTEQQQAKSEGRAPKEEGTESAAASHGRIRARSGFEANQMVAEYRALRATVIRLWATDLSFVATSIEDMVRFNEAVDQAVAESLAEFSQEVDSWRQLFLGAVGHDLRGPLSVVLVTADLLSLRTRDTPLEKQVARLVSSAAHMRKLLDALLEYSKSRLGVEMVIHRATCDLREELRQEIDSLRLILPTASIEFVADGPARGEFDSTRVREAIHNLVANAVKYGDQQSSVVVALTGAPQEVQVTVTNSGPTLKKSLLETMFDPLRRGGQQAATGEDSSLGLGLFIVREIARAHQGDVVASSMHGETKFVVSLPRSA